MEKKDVKKRDINKVEGKGGIVSWKIDGYTSATRAVRAAERRGDAGLTGSGQQCGSIDMSFFSECRGWIYCTWDGRYLIPGGEVAFKIVSEAME